MTIQTENDQKDPDRMDGISVAEVEVGTEKEETPKDRGQGQDLGIEEVVEDEAEIEVEAQNVVDLDAIEVFDET